MSHVGGGNDRVIPSPEQAKMQPLVLERVSKFFGETLALWEVSLTVAPGEVVALLGSNGAGKSTLLRIAAFLLAPTSGTVMVFGQRRPTPEGKRRLTLLGHHSLLYDDLSGEENLRFYAALYGLGERASERIERVLQEVEADAFRYRRVRTLSHGQKKRLSLARALLADPDLLLLDEPFSGLDTTSVERTRHLLAHLRRQGKSLIVTTHQTDLLEDIADATLMLERGRVLNYQRKDARLMASAGLPHAVTRG